MEVQTTGLITYPLMVATNDVLGFQEPASGATGSSASGTPGGFGRNANWFGAISALSVKRLL
jgi:hypothetical protein